MHSKTHYLAAALLWDTLMSKKYAGIKVSFIVNLLLTQANSVGWPKDGYAYAAEQAHPDLFFQAKIRRLMDDQARHKGVRLRPEDEFQLVGNEGESSKWAGSSQLAVHHEGLEYVFSLYMDGQRLSLTIVQNKSTDLVPIMTVFELKLSPTQPPYEGFYQTQHMVNGHAVPFANEITALMKGLVYLGESPRFQDTLTRWGSILRLMAAEIIQIPKSDLPPAGRITIS